MTIPSLNFIIGSIRIGAVEGASCVNIGHNLNAGFESYQKLSQGFGSINGDHNQLEGLRSLLNDAAMMDLLVNRDNTDIPDWLQHQIDEKLKSREAD